MSLCERIFPVRPDCLPTCIQLDENDDGIMFVDEEEDGLTVNPMRRDDEVQENLDKE
jgi:hypothetical protein